MDDLLYCKFNVIGWLIHCTYVSLSRRADETAVQVIEEMLVGIISDSMIGVIICEILPICSNNGPL